MNASSWGWHGVVLLADWGVVLTFYFYSRFISTYFTSSVESELL
jgi:hypothetical protein